MSEFLDQLCKRVPGLIVKTEGADVAHACTDWRKRYQTSALAVLEPMNTSQVQAIVKVCDEFNIAISTQGGNTGLVGGAVPAAAGEAAARQMDGRTLSYTEAVMTALHAGCDLALLCNRSAVDGGAELDEVLDQLAEAQVKGQWQPNEVSEERRLNLLPRSPARPWDELVRSSDYMQALDRLP